MAIEVFLDGSEHAAIRELHDLEIIASVERGNVDARITTDQLTFVNEYAEQIRAYIEGGKNGTSNGIFEGLPLQMKENGVDVFDGFLDFLNDFKIVDPTTVQARIKKHESNNTLQDRANGLTFGFLVDEGFITPNDYISIPYVVEKEFNFVEFATVSFMIYAISKDLIELGTKILEDVKDILGGTFAAGAVAAIIVTINIILFGFMIIALSRLISQLLAFLISPVKFHKGIRLQKLLEKGADFLGLSYNTTIADIPEIVILPSKTGIGQDSQADKILSFLTINQPGEGIPSTADFGYTFGELLSLVNNTFNAEYTVRDGVLEQHTKNAPFWLMESGWVMPCVLDETIQTNANELVSDKIILFKHDVKDFNTLENFGGTTYEIRTRPITVNDERAVLMNGFEKIEIPYALGNRKEKLNRFELLVKGLLKIVDSIINFFPGQNSNKEAKVTARIGMLKLESDYVNIPKLMKMNAQNKLLENDRLTWSAKYLYENYHNEQSFVLNDFGNQYYIYKGVKVPFGFLDFNLLTKNSYFRNTDGELCRIELIQWNVSKDFAIIDYRVQRKYTSNLQETYIEEQ